MEKYKIIEYYIDIYATIKKPLIKKGIDALVPFYCHKFRVRDDGIIRIIHLTVNLILIYF